MLLSNDLTEEQLEYEATILKHVLPRLNSLTLMRQAFSPNVHHVAQVLSVPLIVLQKHVADALLRLQDLLEENKVLVLHCVDIAWQVLSNLPHCELLRVLIVFVQFVPETSTISTRACVRCNYLL